MPIYFFFLFYKLYVYCKFQCRDFPTTKCILKNWKNCAAKRQNLHLDFFSRHHFLWSAFIHIPLHLLLLLKWCKSWEKVFPFCSEIFPLTAAPSGGLWSGSASKETCLRGALFLQQRYNFYYQVQSRKPLTLLQIPRSSVSTEEGYIQMKRQRSSLLFDRIYSTPCRASSFALRRIGLIPPYDNLK